MRMNERLRVIETNYGRDCGWYVEVEGRRVALLTDPQWEDMFWMTYRVEPLTDDIDERALLRTAEFWHSGKIVYRNRRFGAVAPHAFAGGDSATRLAATGRLSMRDLYLAVPHYPWDSLLLWFRRLGSGRRRSGTVEER